MDVYSTQLTGGLPSVAFDQQAGRRRSRRWSERLGDRELRRHSRRVRDRRTKPRRGQPERTPRCRHLGRALRSSCAHPQTGAVQADADLILPNLSSDAAGRFVVFSSPRPTWATRSQRVPRGLSPRSHVGCDHRREPLPVRGAEPRALLRDRQCRRIAGKLQSTTTNLVFGDANGVADIFVRDRPSDLIQVASTSTGLEQADSNSPTSAISADGNYIAFESNGTNLVTPDANGTLDRVHRRHDRAPDRCGRTREGLIPRHGARPQPRVGPEHASHHRAGVRTRRGGRSRRRSDDQQHPTHADPDRCRTHRGERHVGNAKRPSRTPRPRHTPGGSNDQACTGCVSLQRWATNPETVPFAFPIIVLTSNNEFTPTTTAPGYVVQFSSPSDISWPPTSRVRRPGLTTSRCSRRSAAR